MLGDLISKDRVSDTAIRVARDHMIQFARKLPNMLPSVDEPENAETCATPLGQSGMTCALQADHGGVCAASPTGNWNEGWISEPPLPVARAAARRVGEEDVSRCRSRGSQCQ